MTTNDWIDEGVRVEFRLCDHDLVLLDAYFPDLMTHLYLTANGDPDEEELSDEIKEWAFGKMREEIFADRFTRFITACLRWRLQLRVVGWRDPLGLFLFYREERKARRYVAVKRRAIAQADHS